MAVGENKKKLIALLIVIVLLLGLAGFYVSSLPPVVEEEETKVEPYNFTFRNYPVTTGNNDNNEPSIAVNPMDHNNMVAG